MKVLIACEESQAVCKEFRKLGHEAYSCDILDCSGGHPEWHIKEDIFKVIEGWQKVIYLGDCIFEEWDEYNEISICPSCLIDFSDCNYPGCMQEDEFEYKEFDGILYAKRLDFKNWDLMIAFPPCTHLTISGAQHFEKKKLDGRQQQGIDFFMAIINAPIDKIAVENPIGIMSSEYRKPDQIIQPYFFGDPFQKTTCLWLKNLPKLVYNLTPNLFESEVTGTNDKGEFIEIKDKKTGRIKKQPMWYYEAFKNAKTKEERSILRSKTFPGIAKSMANQWGNL
ncbi:hypothetical protein UFOVP215_48 [uncultured Caudovirales phage]|uniref:DNA cytosine methyltransferase n=1 Tax=uncultured Caudovirales phage TaxID=2100421 RepID=A0A6J7WL77_9CAUD|nr:hypothetical protein UFOVP215_48 [uncultured Caudovirales phage]